LTLSVELVRREYSDCLAKRVVVDASGRQTLEDVRIEFEVRSSNFNHNPAGCDLVICWEHDSPSCPVEALELKPVVERLKRTGKR
jgi:hypothetical protein